MPVKWVPFPKQCIDFVHDFVQSKKYDRGLTKALFLKEGIHIAVLVEESWL